MIKLITLTILVVATMNGFGQSKAGLSNQETLSNSNISELNSTSSSAFVGHLQGFSKLEPLYYSFTGGINGKEMLRIKIPNNTIPFDSLIIYVRKSQLRWLNDSTAVINKSN